MIWARSRRFGPGGGVGSGTSCRRKRCAHVCEGLGWAGLLAFASVHWSCDFGWLYLLSSPVVRAEALKFSEQQLKETMRNVLIPFWNAHSFFVTYARVDDWQPSASADSHPGNLSNPLDKWIVSRLEGMVKDVQDYMDHYQLQPAGCRFVDFIDQLTNWYIRRSRRRFWKSSNDTDKNEAYATLYHVLITFCKTAAPFIPFMTETIYRNLRNPAMPESVHLCDFPVAEE